MNKTFQLADYEAKPNLLKDKVIMVTGASSGIGQQAAFAYAQHGATVILLGKNKKGLNQTYDKIIENGGPEPAIYPLNMLGANPDHYQEMAQAIGSNFGKLDGLLNNAGLLGMLTPIANYKVETWYNVMQVNVNAQFHITQSLLPLLKKSVASSIVFTSSGVGRQGRAYWGAYSVSKFAIEGLAQTLADELEESTVRCNTINPGRTRTKMRAAAYPAEDPSTIKSPESLMPIYLYLMGEDSQDCNGVSFDVE